MPDASARDLQVVGQLGRGGHTVTYRVRRDGSEYAMKVLRLGAGTPDEERSFRREAALLAAVDDPGIARVHEVGRWRGEPYLLMDLVEGRQLSAMLADGPLPVPRLLSVGIDVARALRAAHRAGVVHRDIKPDNIIVGSDFRARVIDFGLAVRTGEFGGETVAGTMLYGAPEQTGMLNRPVDGRADLYALGSVLFECATGRPPFASDNVGELLRMHATTPPPDPHSLRPDLPTAAAAIIGRLLAKDPDDRYQSPDGLIADLLTVLADPASPLGTPGHPLGTADTAIATTARYPLVGRAAEMSILERRWARARDGNGGVVLIEGPPGVGKSRLAAELGRVATDAGALVLTGKSDEDQSTPMAPLRAAIERHLRTLLALPEPLRAQAVAEVVAAAGPAPALLRNLSPALDSVLQAPELAGDDRPQQFSAAVAGFLLALARSSGGAVLHLDDVQWLDDATSRVLRHLAPSLPTEPLLVVATARRETTSEPAVAALRSAVGRSLCADMQLAPLSAEAVGELVSSASGGLKVDRATAARMAARSDGNPFTLLQYLNAIVDSGLVRPAWGNWLVDADELRSLDLPASGRELVGSRLDGLTAQSRYLLGVAAVIGTRFTPDLVAEVSRADVPQVRAIAEVAASKNLVERRGRGRYAFLHDQIREELLAQFDEATRRGVHQRVADVLEQDPVRTAEITYALARHCQLGGLDRNPERTVRACTEAGRLALADHAPAEALDFLATAVDAARAAGIELDPSFLQTVGVAQHRAGRFRDAAETLRQAHDRSTDPVERARILSLIARVHDSTWDTAEQAATVERALAELGRPLPRNRFVLVVSTVWLFVLGVLVRASRIGYGTATGARREHYGLVSSLYDAAALANARQLRPTMALVFTVREVYPVNRLGAGPERARMDIAIAHLAQIVGAHRLAGGLTRRAQRTAAALGDPRLQAYVAWLWSLDRFFFGVDQGESIRRTLAEYGRWLDPGQASDLLHALHWDALLRGDLADYSDLYDRRAALLEASNQAGRMAAHASRAGQLALQGRGAQAMAHLEQMRAARPDSLPWETVDLLYATMLVAVERHDLGATFDDAAARFQALRLSPLMLVPAEWGLYVHLAYGRLEQCRIADPQERPTRLAQAAKAVRQLKRAAKVPMLRAHYRVAEASLAQLRGHPEEALLLLNRSEPVLRAVDAALVIFEARRVRARALRALQVFDEANRQARFALSLAIEQGWAYRVGRTAAEFGLRPTAGKASGATPKSSDDIALGVYRERLTAIERMSLAASRVVDPATLVTIALDETVRILGAERAFLFPAHDPAAGELARLVPRRGRDAAGHDLVDLVDYSPSLVERVRDTREALVITSAEEGAAMGAQSVVLHGLRSVLVAPLEFDGRLLGVVYLDSRVANGIFSDHDVGVLVAITNHIAVALETARTAQLEAAVAAANRQRDLAETVRDALAEITGPLESQPEQVLRRLLATVRRLVPGELAWLVLSTADAGKVHIIDDPDAEPTTVDPDAALAGVLAGGPPLQAPAQVPRNHRWLAVPLVAREVRLGALLLASSDPGAYDQGWAEIIIALVGQAMVAYENTRLFAQVQQMASTDGLTGIANRSHFFDSARDALSTARREGQRIAAMMIDIDHFKVVNDSYGHRVGDEVIQAVAARLGQVATDPDLFGRYGGEEFAVVLPQRAGDAMTTAERLRRTVAASAVPTSAGPLDVTVSVGVTYQRPNDSDLSDVLARADRSLLRAKRAGRDRVLLD